MATTAERGGRGARAEVRELWAPRAREGKFHRAVLVAADAGLERFAVGFAAEPHTGGGGGLELFEVKRRLRRELPESVDEEGASQVMAAGFSRDGALLVATRVTLDGAATLQAWDAATGKHRWDAAIAEGSEEGDADQEHAPLALSDDGATVAAASARTGVVRVIRARTGKPVAAVEAAGRVECVALAAGGAWLAVGTARGGLEVWDVRARRRTASARAGVGTVLALAFAPDAGELLVVGSKPALRRYPLRDGALGRGATQTLPARTLAPTDAQLGQAQAGTRTLLIASPASVRGTGVSRARVELLDAEGRRRLAEPMLEPEDAARIGVDCAAALTPDGGAVVCVTPRRVFAWLA